jgi:hypothetical protein
VAYVIFTAADSSRYDDDITRHYHFPKTYLAQVENGVRFSYPKPWSDRTFEAPRAPVVPHVARVERTHQSR